MGTVYQAEDLLTGFPVAVKVMHPSAAIDASAVQRFVSEAAAAAITHPGVIKTLHIDVTAEGRIYLLMEYVEGTDRVEVEFRCGRGFKAPAR
jgi:serine/threonine-protein kinase